MLRAIQLYHPSYIFREKREKSLDVSSSDTISDIKEESAEVHENQPKELLAARDYLEKVVEATDAFNQKITELGGITHKAGRSTTTDIERKALIKEFNHKRSDLDKMAQQTSIDGDLLFSGKFESKDKVIKISDDLEFSFKMKAFDSNTLGLQRARIDSPAVAKKTLEEIDTAKEFINASKKHIHTALTEVEKRLKPRSSGSSSSKVKFSYENPAYVDLKIRQEDIAEATGRTHGLLVNMKG